MFPSSFLSVVVASLAVAASATPFARVDKPPVTLSLSRRLNLTSTHSLVRQDQVRAQTLILNGKVSNDGLKARDISNVPVINQAVSYIATIAVGTPPTDYELIIDTGSSNTWVGANKPYVETSSSVKTLNKVAVSYGSGKFSGTEYLDTVSAGDGLVIHHQSIGVASTSEGFSGVDGILGVGPTDLTIGTLTPVVIEPIPTVTDNLYYHGIIPAKEIGILFQPTTSVGAPDGEITWGGVDSSNIVGDVTWIPITSTAPANTFWGIDQSIAYGDTTILSSTAGIVDTGTTLVLIATDAFQKYQEATGAVKDTNTGLLSITPDQFDGLQSLFFNAEGTSFQLTPNAQLWPRALNTDIGGVAGNIYLIVADLGTPSGQGMDFINGMSFLQRFYSVYDSANNRVGLAPTPFTDATTN